MRTKVAYLNATIAAPFEVSVSNHAGIFDSRDLKVQIDIALPYSTTFMWSLMNFCLFVATLIAGYAHTRTHAPARRHDEK
jgi:hypothetical protein